MVHFLGHPVSLCERFVFKFYAAAVLKFYVAAVLIINKRSAKL